MALPNTPPDANTHEPAKGPNFELVIYIAAVLLLVLLGVAYFFLRGQAQKLILHPPTHPTALILPAPR